jgi:NADH-quinone oxidoreductase subunit M
MNVLQNPLIWVTFFPLVGMAVIAFLKPEQKNAIRLTALAASLITFGLSLWMLAAFNAADPGIQQSVNLAWIKAGDMQVNFQLGLDGLNVLMVLLTTFLTPIVILSTWQGITERVKTFMLVFMLLETALLGVFLALDLALFFLFWELTLVPMYFLIGIWGSENRLYAAVKFFLYTMAGSVFMMVAIFFIGINAGTFSYTELAANPQVLAGAQLWLFLAFAIAFAIKVPMWPFHTWLPDAHTQAPTAGSVILAGVLLKMGTYGFLRFNIGLFPEMAVKAAPFIAVLAVIGIIYGALVSFAQKDLKRLVAYSSISHLGFVMLGLFALNAQGISGAILQMVNHGLSTGALFLIVGMLYERRHTRELEAFGGLWKVVPVLGTIMLVVTLSSVGLPGLNGFVGEFTILLGAFNSDILGSPWFGGVAALGVILAAVYLFQMFEKAFLGPVRHEENRQMKDVNWREIAVLAPLLILIFWIGLYPKPFFSLINPAVENLVEIIQGAALAVK